MSNTLHYYEKKYPHMMGIFFMLMSLLYYKYNILGFIISVISLLLGFLLFYTDGYSVGSMIKMYLVAVKSFLIFYKLNFKSKLNIDYVLTILLAMNIFVLICSVVENPFVKIKIKNYFLAFCLLVVSLSTPLVSISKKKLKMTKLFTNVNVYIILYTITLVYYFNVNNGFAQHKYLHLFGLLIPFISHFTNNRWLETRCFLLCLIVIYDIIDKINYMPFISIYS